MSSTSPSPPGPRLPPRTPPTPCERPWSTVRKHSLHSNESLQVIAYTHTYNTVYIPPPSPTYIHTYIQYMYKHSRHSNEFSQVISHPSPLLSSLSTASSHSLPSVLHIHIYTNAHSTTLPLLLSPLSLSPTRSQPCTVVPGPCPDAYRPPVEDRTAYPHLTKPPAPPTPIVRVPIIRVPIIRVVTVTTTA